MASQKGHVFYVEHPEQGQIQENNL